MRNMPEIGSTIISNDVTYTVELAKDGCKGCSLLELRCWAIDRPNCKGFGESHDRIFVESIICCEVEHHDSDKWNMFQDWRHGTR